MLSRRIATARGEARKTAGSTMREKSCQWIITVVAERRDWELGSWMGFALYLFMRIWERMQHFLPGGKHPTKSM